MGVAVDLDRWLDAARLVVCVGSGGVGKTTTAAAIAVRGARRGRRAIVLTIDPARRLATSLGLSAIGNQATRIHGDDLPGELWAAMLDSQGTFDDLVRRIAPSSAVRERILANHVYRHMSDAFAGSQDYMAIERLYDLATDPRYDLVVLDTPPAKNALDFLESPGRLVNFLDERVLRWFLAPYEGRRWFGTSSVVHWLLGQVFGKEFLDDLAGFFQDFEGLYEGFRARHDAVGALLRAPTTQFVTVCAPTEPSADIAAFFQSELTTRGFARGGVIVNQVHHCHGADHDAAARLGPTVAELAADVPDPVRRAVLARLGMAHRRLRDRAIADARVLELIRATARGGGFLAPVPRFDDDIHHLSGLVRLGAALFDAPAETLEAT
jgi:anion-transporting  ArsA/GET3 family ATPase